MISRSYIHGIIFLFMLINITGLACLPKSEWENITSDHESTLNVFGLISLDETVPSFVRVHQTLGLGNKKDVDWSFIVKNATVSIYDGTNEYIFTFEESEEEFHEIESGWYTNSSFNPQPNRTYTLLITTPDGRRLTGLTHTPGFPNLDDSSVPDTVFSQKPYTIGFDLGGSNYASLRINLSGWICGAEHNVLISPGTKQWTTPPTDCSGVYRSPIDNSKDLLTIALINLDDNYYEYFLRQRPDDNFIDFFAGSGRTAVSIGVDGGYGIFGAIAADRIYRVIVP